jgi:two-component system response regulator TctD
MNKLLEAPCDQAAAKPEGNLANPPHRILVVADDRDLRRINAMVLTHAGYAVDMAEDGAAAWEALQANRYELVITDNNMPRLTGIELLKKLRSARMELPVIMATGTLPTQELAQNPWLEPVAMLAKPYATDRLLDTVKDVLRATDSLREQLEPLPEW